ncbi:MAG: peptide ABC transporter substrate-binding protein [Spirochaetales bacterium]|nr:peptide ABC transporter substrate-binding protein [Spirochaetales bacterium]
MKKICLFILIISVLFSAFFVSCKKEAEEKGGGGELVVWNQAEPQSLDWHLIEGVPEHRIYYSLGEGLVSSDPETAEPVPGVAESWEIDPTGTKITFKLRKTTWSDGVPITAQTFVDSWLRILDPKTAAPYAWFPGDLIKGAGDFMEGTAGPESVGIRAVDDYTFEVTLVGAMPAAVSAMSHYAFAIVPLHKIKENPDSWTMPENYVGNGPFVLDEWKPQEILSVKKNDKYWDKKNVKLDRVVYIPTDDDNVGFNMYLNGEVDWAPEVPLEQLDAVKLRDDYVVAPYLGVYYYIFQVEKPPVNDVRVRKALSMALDRKTLVEKVTAAGETAGYSMVPPMAGYDPTPGIGEDLAKAKQLLAEAGYPDGKGFPKLEILYNTSDRHLKIAEFIQEQWEKNLGIKCELVNQEWKTYLDTRKQGEFMVARAGWIADYPDPSTFLDMFGSGKAMNGGKYSNKEFDELIGKASTMKPGPERFAALRKAEDIFITQDQGVMPIYHYVSQSMIDTTKWGGWYPNAMDWHPTKTIYKK